ncbi:MAG TPA: hypothetical protein VGN16_23695 [Acidobacteriaceae bacterium]
MMTVFVFLILAQFALVASHDLIDVPGWNHGSQVKALMGTRKVWIATAINSIFPGVAAGMAMYFWHRSPPHFAPNYWLIYCAISLLSAIGMWYIPYWRGASETTRSAYRAMYAGTRHILPARGDNPRPNVFHMGLHVLFVVNFCLSLSIWLHRR